MKFQEHPPECSARCLVMHSMKDAVHMLLCDSQGRKSSVQGDAVSVSCFFNLSSFAVLPFIFWWRCMLFSASFFKNRNTNRNGAQSPPLHNWEQATAGVCFKNWGKSILALFHWSWPWCIHLCFPSGRVAFSFHFLLQKPSQEHDITVYFR